MMNIKLDPKKLNTQITAALITPEHQLPEPSARVEGVSFPAIPMLKRALTTSVVAVGTITVGQPQPINIADLRDFRVNTVIAPSDAGSPNLAEHYARLKQEIVASGVPLLNDEELRREIRERKGIKTETDN